MSEENKVKRKKTPKALKGAYKPFDPRVSYKTESDKAAARQVWSTKSIEMARQAVAEGLDLKADPFFPGNPLLKKPNLLFRRTKEEKAEFIRCKFDLLYFAEKYCQLLTDSGDYEHITLRPYQKKLLVAFATKSKTICLGSRQIGKTVTSSIFNLWYIIFHKNIAVGLLGDKIPTAVENLNKIKEILYRLPIHLQPGIVSWNVRSIKLDNRSYVFTGPCNKSAIVGKTANILFIDEFAIPSPKLAKEVADFAFPVVETMIKAGRGKIIITSTPNGEGPFKEIWQKAIYGENSYYPVKVPWYLVPGRDLAWRKEKVADIGYDAFQEQYNAAFLSSSNCIFNDLTIKELESNKVKFERAVFGGGPIDNILHRVMRKAPSTLTEPSENFRIKDGYDISEFKKPHLITIDIAEGILGDYTVFNVFKPIYRQDLIDKSNKSKANLPMDDDDEYSWMADDTNYEAMSFDDNCAENVDFEQVAVFHSNSHCVRTSALFLRILFTQYFNPENSRLVIELNKYGGQFLDLMLNHSLYPEYGIEQESIAFYQTHHNTKLTQGIMYNGSNKKLFVRQTKTDIETGRIKLFDSLSIAECTTFGENSNGTYSGAIGAHDDIFMSTATLSAYAQPENDGFVIWVEEIFTGGEAYDDDEDFEDSIYDNL